jgi:hypothetical protein
MFPVHLIFVGSVEDLAVACRLIIIVPSLLVTKLGALLICIDHAPLGF